MGCEGADEETGKVAVRPDAARLRKRRGRAVRVMVRWSREREERFLESLCTTPNVCEAARVSGLSESSVYRRRAASAEFRAKWHAALCVGYAKLEASLLSRAINGVEKPVFFGGKQIGTIRDYDDRVSVSLLRFHRETVTGNQPSIAREPIEAARARLAAHLSEMNRRMGGAG